LLEITQGNVKTVATDGHRLAYCECEADVSPADIIQIILPRKGVIELTKLLEADQQPAHIIVGTNHLQLTLPDITFTSKLVDGRFPDYERVIPRTGDKNVVAERDSLRQTLARTSILSNEKYRGIRLRLSNGLLQSQAHNPEMEEAEEEVEVQYEGDDLEIGFNVNYLLDALNVIPTAQVNLIFGDANSSCLMTPADDQDSGCQYVIMPMRL
jgi:DNA polymerase-3 subunit beta